MSRSIPNRQRYLLEELGIPTHKVAARIKREQDKKIYIFKRRKRYGRTK